MFRALSTRRSPQGYQQLADESSTAAPKLSRAKSLPAKLFSLKEKSSTAAPPKSPAEQAKKASKIHPFFSLFETKRKKKATAKPEFSRYLEYVREGGTWDMKANAPVIYYK